jgi:hypothetical protein
MNLKELWGKKWFRLGVPVAGGLGLVALYMRKKSTGSTSTAPATQQKAAGGVGMFDSTGTDVAHWVGEHDAKMQEQLTTYQTQLTDSVSAFNKFLAPLGRISGAHPLDDARAAGDLGYGWDPVQGAAEYVVHYVDQKGNSSGAYRVTDPSIMFHNLDAGQQYQLVVTPWSPGGGYGQEERIYAQTKAK